MGLARNRLAALESRLILACVNRIAAVWMRYAGTLIVLVASLLAMPQPASAQEDGWADKSGVIGLGASTTLGGVTGVTLRTYLGPRFGLHGTVSFGLGVGSRNAGDVDFDASFFDIRFGAYVSYKLASWRRGHLSGIAGADLLYLTSSTDVPGGGSVDASGVDILAGLGLLGELFAARHLSLHVELGVRVGLLGNVPYGADRVPLPDADGWDFSGKDIGLGADLLGAAGFTVWFE